MNARQMQHGRPVPEDRRMPTGRGHPRLQLVEPATAAPEMAANRPVRRWVSGPRILVVLTALLLYWGWSFPTEQYISPATGLGYLLGIVGGSSMLLLLVYPLRKRLRALAFLGNTRHWFQAHMVLGILGPVLILFHSNFELGATNSNVALACMLVVSGSGLFGRYFYSHIHHGLYGRRATLAELQQAAEKLRWVSTSVQMLPELAGAIDAAEDRMARLCDRAPLLLRPTLAAVATFLARRRLRRDVTRMLRAAQEPGGAHPDRQRQLHALAIDYVDARLHANRRVLVFAAFERFFSLWHALHLPLFVMLVVAGIAHVLAVHLY